MRFKRNAAGLLATAIMIMAVAWPAATQDQAKNLGPAVNSEDSDFGPIITADGNALYFTSDREGGYGGQDIWVSRRTADGNWGSPENLGDEINTKYNEGPDTFSVDERTMYFTRCDRVGQPGTCDIYMASFNETTKRWGGVKNLGAAINSRFNDANASLSYDENTLYFVSNRPTEDRKRSNWDIFISKRQGGDWGTAQRLGPPINTPMNELHVMIHQDNQTLYFSSDGHGGFGGADILVSRIDSGQFSEPRNLGPLINTPDNDMYFTIPASGDLAYLASNRSGTMGQEDLYSVPIPLVLQPQGVIIVKGIVADRTTCAEPTADPATGVAVYDIKTCAPINEARVRLSEVVSDVLVKQSVTGPSGFYQVIIPAGNDYSVSASAPNYSFHTERFNVAQKQPYEVIEKNILLEPFVTGARFVINNVYFDFDKATLRPESKNELQNAIRWLKQNRNVKVEVGGHTDSKGSDTYNIRLSQRRAKSVMEYLIQNGIAPNRLTAYGYGERMPIASNSTDEGRQLNRRVEFKILQY